MKNISEMTLAEQMLLSIKIAPNPSGHDLDTLWHALRNTKYPVNRNTRMAMRGSIYIELSNSPHEWCAQTKNSGTNIEGMWEFIRTHKPAISRPVPMKFHEEVLVNKYEIPTIKELTMVENIKTETIDEAQVQVGRVIYQNAKTLLVDFIPQPTWYEKLLTTDTKRELATLLVVYGLLHFIKSKYSHYAFDALTMYINRELQEKVLDTVGINNLAKIMVMPTKV